jgi:hypothetical protein
MLWHINYNDGRVTGRRSVRGRECAINIACQLLDDGWNVLHLGQVDALATIGAIEIRHINEQRKIAR